VIICDTGPLLAAANVNDVAHEAAAAVFDGESGPLIVPALVVTEVCYMLAKLGPSREADFLRSLAREELLVESLTTGDYDRIADLVVQYGSFPLGAADASVVAVAERLGVTRVATIDHRHFRQVVPRHCAALDLLPSEHELARHR
jgi:uncharacterized protein